MSVVLGATILGTMFQKSYAVLWREGDGPVSAGKLVLGPKSLRLDAGAGRTRSTSRVLRYAELATVGMAALADRIRSRPTAVVERNERDRLTIAVLDGTGSVREIVEQLAAQLAGRRDP
jgi:hypothetical protein